MCFLYHANLQNQKEIYAFNYRIESLVITMILNKTRVTSFQNRF